MAARSLTQRTLSIARRVTRFSIASMMWMCLLAAVLVLWYRDHQQLTQRIYGRTSSNQSAWSINQLVGQPDTTGFGDIRTAWASQTPDGQEETLIVEFPVTVDATAAEVYETYNPGAVIRVAAVSTTGTETPLWSGTDPLLGTAGGVALLPFSAPHRTRRIKIVIDSESHPGWNEIDAVGLIDRSGRRQWAHQAWASSSYGKNRRPPTWYWP